MISTVSSSNIQKFFIDDLEPHQVLRLRFSGEGPVFKKLDSSDVVAKLWDDSIKAHLVKVDHYDTLTTPVGIVVYSQIIYPSDSKNCAVITAPRFVFNNECFLMRGAEITLKSNKISSPCQSISIKAKDISKPVHIKGGVNFDPNPLLDESQYADLSREIHDAIGQPLKFMPLSLHHVSSSLDFTNAIVTVIYQSNNEGSQIF